ncbi:hypothetical protein ACQZV8_01770 [Magnetococcales bacterium HHB-1]
MAKYYRVIFILSLLTLSVIFSQTAQAVPSYRRGCEFPLEKVQVCWEAKEHILGSDGPYNKVHFLPISREWANREEVFVDYTRKVYRQLATSGLADRVVQEWEPAYTLDQAINQVWSKQDWPAVLWIHPRIIRESGSITSGVIDWDIYLISGSPGKQRGQIVRSYRVRVESHPKTKKINTTQALTTAGLAMLTRETFAPNMSTSGFLSVVAGGMMLSDPPPPEAGYPLELLTELAVRQLLFLTQYPVDELNPAKPVKGDALERAIRHPNAVPTASQRETKWYEHGWN